MSGSRNSGKWPGSRVWNLRLTLGKTMQGAELHEMEWAPPKKHLPFSWLRRTTRLRSMDRGSGLHRWDEPPDSSVLRPSPMPREGEAALRSSGQPVVE
jgi:hypothetical protein